MTDKPLHVQAAEALGWDYSEDRHEWDEFAEGQKRCTRCHEVAPWTRHSPSPCCPRYDTDWAATGPLIERFGFVVGRFRILDRQWYAILPGTTSPDAQAEEHAPTPLLAVCYLILALKEAGKL